MSYQKVNNITGWIVCAIACLTYILTAEAGGSLWDCGEFVSSAYKLQVPHPPGAPMFTLIGRFFIILFGDNPNTAAKAVNMMSALASGFTILFLFWTITHFARKIVLKSGGALEGGNLVAVMGAGIVGGLAYTFSDSFWYSAVEGEVYALSSFFTALVFWAILKWEREVDAENENNEGKGDGSGGHFSPADRWIVFIFFMMGLSIGVHLLNLLTIPAIVMVIYYKRYKHSTSGALIAFLIGCVITGVCQKAVIQYTIKAAGSLDIFFVNNLNLPFFSGFAFFFLLMVVLIWVGLRFAKKENLNFLRLGLWSFAFMMIGYSTYLTTMIRSNANPAVDMYNVDNPQSLVGYLGREQYGDFPLLYGQKFTAQPSGYKEGATKYQKGNEKYIEAGKDFSYEYEPGDMMFLPRVWDASNDQGHADFYKQWLNLADGEAPTMRDNVYWAWTYQLNWMYWRYFMWNFAGKQNDNQGFGNARDGNWISGVSFFDNWRLGDQSKLPDSLKNNKANNKLFFLPFILGLMGLVYHYTKHRTDFVINLLLFLFTGLAIVFYLNQPGNQPRERDYAYVGSFYAFAVWIGIGVMQVRDWFGGLNKNNASTGSLVATALCTLAVPVLMASQEWDDHDRSKKQVARDLAKDYLESCAPNAIVFSFGDNDTYPLWYAQEVEGIRRDVRVINNSLLGIDWYINQLRYKVNGSDPIDVILTPEQIEARKRDVSYFVDNPGINSITPTHDLYTVIKQWVGSDDPDKVRTDNDNVTNTVPCRNFTLPVDKAAIAADPSFKATDKILDTLHIDIAGKNYLVKNDLAVLAIIAANKWKRPIYFTGSYETNGWGIGKYIRRDGLTYRLVPIENQKSNVPWMYDKMMNKFAFGNANTKGVYFDEENRRHLINIRNAYGELAAEMAAVNGKDSARNILKRADSELLESNLPYGYTDRFGSHNVISMRFMEAAYMADDKALAQKVAGSLKKDLQQQITYYESLSEAKMSAFAEDYGRAREILKYIEQVEANYNKQPMPPGKEGAVPITNLKDSN
jgi:hypothetical protein